MGDHISNACAALKRRAIGRGVPEEIAEYARAATLRADRRADGMTHRRADAYFWAVVRRQSIRRPSGRDMAERLVLDAVIDDLRLAGREDDAIVGELERGWRSRVGEEAYAAARARLCA